MYWKKSLDLLFFTSAANIIGQATIVFHLDLHSSLLNGFPCFYSIILLMHSSHNSQNTFFNNINHITILPCLKPSYGFPFLLESNPNILKALPDLVYSTSLTLSPTILPIFAYYASALQVFFSFHKPAQLVPTSGPLHLLFHSLDCSSVDPCEMPLSCLSCLISYIPSAEMPSITT